MANSTLSPVIAWNWCCSLRPRSDRTNIRRLRVEIFDYQWTASSQVWPGGSLTHLITYVTCGRPLGSLEWVDVAGIACSQGMLWSLFCSFRWSQYILDFMSLRGAALVSASWEWVPSFGLRWYSNAFCAFEMDSLPAHYQTVVLPGIINHALISMATVSWLEDVLATFLICGTSKAIYNIHVNGDLFLLSPSLWLKILGLFCFFPT